MNTANILPSQQPSLETLQTQEAAFTNASLIAKSLGILQEYKISQPKVPWNGNAAALIPIVHPTSDQKITSKEIINQIASCQGEVYRYLLLQRRLGIKHSMQLEGVKEYQESPPAFQVHFGNLGGTHTSDSPLAEEIFFNNPDCLVRFFSRNTRKAFCNLLSGVSYWNHQQVDVGPYHDRAMAQRKMGMDTELGSKKWLEGILSCSDALERMAVVMDKNFVHASTLAPSQQLHRVVLGARHALNVQDELLSTGWRTHFAIPASLMSDDLLRANENSAYRFATQWLKKMDQEDKNI